MIVIDNTYLSDDLIEKEFVCNLSKCKGACCVIGDAGAPLDQEEIKLIEQDYDTIKDYMTPKGVEAIAQEGSVFVIDEEGDLTTTTIDNQECAFAVYDKDQTLACGIEMAYNDGKIDFQKPISCHLYPIRITPYDMYDAVNYHRWDICVDACALGSKLSVPVYQFLKAPLIRKYGSAWYDKLEALVQEEKDNNEER